MRMVFSALESFFKFDDFWGQMDHMIYINDVYLQKRQTDMWTMQRNQQLAVYSRLNTLPNCKVVSDKEKVKLYFLGV